MAERGRIIIALTVMEVGGKSSTFGISIKKHWKGAVNGKPTDKTITS